MCTRNQSQLITLRIGISNSRPTHGNSISFNTHRQTLLTVKIHGAGRVTVNFLDHLVQLVVGELVVEGEQDLAQRVDGYVAVALLVVQPERLLELEQHHLVVLLLRREPHHDSAERIKL